MTENNPFIYDDSKVTSEQAYMIRENNLRMFTLTSNLKLMDTEAPDAFNKLSLKMPKHISRASSGTYLRNPKNMDVTEYNKKVQALMRELAENKIYPEYRDPSTNKPLSARQVFFSSFFWQNLAVLYNGDAYQKEPTQWSDYLRTDVPFPSYVNPKCNPMATALSIYVKDNQEIGIDMDKMLDTVLVSDIKGNYKLHPDNSFNTNNLLAEAVMNQTRILKDNNVFKKLYLSPENGRDDSEKF